MNRFWSRAALIPAMAVVLGGASAVAAYPPALAAAGRGPSSQALPVMAGQLHAVAAVSARDAWAVGCSGGCNGPDSLILHWNGSKWSKVASPDPGAGSDVLTGVSARSATDVWAVGYDCNAANCLGATNVFRTLILHWNGRKWSPVASPDPNATLNQLEGVAAVSATDVWAVGSTFSNTLVLHWNGRKWSRVASPHVNGGPTLYGVSADSASDAWAVGGQIPTPSNVTHTVILHWNGTRWSRVKSPDPGARFNALFGVSSVSPADAWAVGDYASPAGIHSLILHWNGTKWSQATSANPGSSFNNLNGVSAASAGDIWAAGDQLGASIPYLTLTEHWNGTGWSAVNSPNQGSGTLAYNVLAGVSAISPRRAIAVGWAQSGPKNADQTLILMWNGKSWSRA